MTSPVFHFGPEPFTPLLIVISGPSGIGKDAVVQALRVKNPKTHFVITMTSRLPRAEEQDGVDYFFVSRQEFEALIASGELLEHARVYSDYKGIPRQQVRQALKSGKDVIMRLDVQGAMTIRSLCPEAVLIFLTANSREEWIARLAGRCSESPEEFALRIKTAEMEYEKLDAFDYIVVNSDNKLNETVETIQKIITAEHQRVHPRQVSL
ncbi:MAG TPA: guanylate kinase [Anaerolineaceae bacterium]|jgi:guanylate kinase|nr:guanylate kinase [Anaerolineaceae bacterium]